MEKKCSKCGEVKSFSEFYKRKTSKDGLYSRCKMCKLEYKRDNKEKIKESSKQYRENNKEYTITNRYIINATSAKNRFKKDNAIGPNFNHEDVKSFYLNANGMEVDHIAPLNVILPDGKKIKGLHTPSNLQLLTTSENKAKGNRIGYEELEKLTLGIDYVFIEEEL